MHGVVNFNRGSLFSWVREYWLASAVTSSLEKGWLSDEVLLQHMSYSAFIHAFCSVPIQGNTYLIM